MIPMRAIATSGIPRTGYMVHERDLRADRPHLLTHVYTTAATVHEAQWN